MQKFGAEKAYSDYRDMLAKEKLDEAWQVTRIFEAFSEGPGKVISLK